MKSPGGWWFSSCAPPEPERLQEWAWGWGGWWVGGLEVTNGERRGEKEVLESG